jgi:hypothetical protein
MARQNGCGLTQRHKRRRVSQPQSSSSDDDTRNAPPALFSCPRPQDTRMSHSTVQTIPRLVLNLHQRPTNRIILSFARLLPAARPIRSVRESPARIANHQPWQTAKARKSSQFNAKCAISFFFFSFLPHRCSLFVRGRNQPRTKKSQTPSIEHENIKNYLNRLHGVRLNTFCS